METLSSLRAEGITPESFRQKYLHELRSTLASASQQLAKAQARYKKNFDARVQPRNTTLKVGDYVFVDDPTPGEDASKLTYKTKGPYLITGMDGTRHTVALKRGQLRDRVSMDRVTPAPSPLGDSTPGLPVPPPRNASVRIAVPPPSTHDVEYVVEKIVNVDLDELGNILCKVRWMGYLPEEDTWEPGEGLPPHLVRRACARHGFPLPPYF
jgi:Chromo (CHRromatin Organisation MOdifier) domain